MTSQTTSFNDLTALSYEGCVLLISTECLMFIAFPCPFSVLVVALFIINWDRC